MKPGDNVARRLLQILAIWGMAAAVAVSMVVLVGERDADKRAVVAMGLGLIVIWCALGGLVMRLTRDRFAEWSRRLTIGWPLRFVLLCMAMALLEEAVTTSLTNAAPLLGAATEAARITSSKNYFEVISRSVVAFTPWFICWAWLLKRYDFRPLEVMLLFGLTGTLAESITFGFQHLAEIGMWVFVYGLMVYLPVQTVPGNRNVKPVRWWHWIAAVALPLVFILPLVVFAVAAVIKKASRICVKGAR